MFLILPSAGAGPAANMMASRVLLAFALFLQLNASSSSAVDSSKCVAIWTFKFPCTEPVRDLVNQVKTWSTKKCHSGPERCMYEIKIESQRELEVTHTSSQTGKVTNMNFVFGSTPNPFCKIKAITRSQNSTNPNDYCLLYSLIDASRVTQAPGYEICNENMCPSKSSSASCNSKDVPV